MICTVTRGVFIAQLLTYPLAKITIMPSNCHKYRISHGLPGNNKFYRQLSGLQMARHVGLCLASGPSSLGISGRDFGPGLRHASPSLLLRLVTLRPWVFAVCPSPSCRTRVDRCVVGSGPSSKSLRFEVFARPSTYYRLALRPCVLAPSHRSPKVAPPTVTPRGFRCSSGHPKARQLGG